MEKKKNDSIWTKFTTWVLIATIVLVGIVCFFPMWFTQSYWSGLDFTETGQIGDTIGGIMGPFIAIVAAGLTFIAFWVQYEANQQQRRDIKLERFENKFYEMLRLHKENINELKKIGRDNVIIEGRSVFPSMYKELWTSYKVCEIVLKKFLNDKLVREYKAEEIIKLAYIHVYTGVGETGKIVNQAIAGTQFEEILLNDLRKYLNEIRENFKKNGIAETVVLGEKVSMDIIFQPYRGYISRIGHYYRHLYQTIKFIDGLDFLSFDEKYNYARILRAQLSDHEQVMLFYNVVSNFGEKWLEVNKGEYYGLIIKYKMIHNAIPKLLELNEEASPYKHDVFSKQLDLWHKNNPNKEFFEWYE